MQNYKKTEFKLRQTVYGMKLLFADKTSVCLPACTYKENSFCGSQPSSSHLFRGEWDTAVCEQTHACMYARCFIRWRRRQPASQHRPPVAIKQAQENEARGSGHHHRWSYEQLARWETTQCSIYLSTYYYFFFFSSSAHSGFFPLQLLWHKVQIWDQQVRTLLRGVRSYYFSS